ncbi:hypothetical protein EF912_21630 [Streptomyces sp. WAC07061]|nr:hypothetical protein EF912_21630 [Streptomyces sp. WAC07061]
MTVDGQVTPRSSHGSTGHGECGDQDASAVLGRGPTREVPALSWVRGMQSTALSVVHRTERLRPAGRLVLPRAAFSPGGADRWAGARRSPGAPGRGRQGRGTAASRSWARWYPPDGLLTRKRRASAAVVVSPPSGVHAGIRGAAGAWATDHPPNCVTLSRRATTVSPRVAGRESLDVSLDVLAALCSILHVTPAELITITETHVRSPSRPRPARPPPPRRPRRPAAYA